MGNNQGKLPCLGEFGILPPVLGLLSQLLESNDLKWEQVIDIDDHSRINYRAYEFSLFLLRQMDRT